MSASNAPPIRVRLFASYAERFGRDSLELPADGVSTAADVVRRLEEAGARGLFGPHTLIAVNLRQASSDAAVAPGDEIAIMPPLAGG